MKRSILILLMAAALACCISCNNPAGGSDSSSANPICGSWYDQETGATSVYIFKADSTGSNDIYCNGSKIETSYTWSADSSNITMTSTAGGSSDSQTYSYSFNADQSVLTLIKTVSGQTVTATLKKGTPSYPATMVSIVGSSTVSLSVGDTISIVPLVTPLYSTDVIVWSSSNSAVATVATSLSSSIVTGVAAGSATITGTIGTKSVSWAVTVN